MENANKPYLDVVLLELLILFLQRLCFRFKVDHFRLSCFAVHFNFFQFCFVLTLSFEIRSRTAQSPVLTSKGARLFLFFANLQEVRSQCLKEVQNLVKSRPSAINFVPKCDIGDGPWVAHRVGVEFRAMSGNFDKKDNFWLENGKWTKKKTNFCLDQK